MTLLRPRGGRSGERCRIVFKAKKIIDLDRSMVNDEDVLPEKRRESGVEMLQMQITGLAKMNKGWP